MQKKSNCISGFYNSILPLYFTTVSERGMGVGQVRAVLQEGDGKTEGEGEEQPDEAMCSQI
jgi:hypothetical protein